MGIFLLSHFVFPSAFLSCVLPALLPFFTFWILLDAFRSYPTAVSWIVQFRLLLDPILADVIEVYFGVPSRALGSRCQVTRCRQMAPQACKVVGYVELSIVYCPLA